MRSSRTRDVLDRIGFEVEPFGGRTVALHAVPNPHPRFDAARCFREMVADLARGRFGGWANRHGTVRRDLRLPCRGQGGGPRSTSGRCASCCCGSSPRRCRRTTCMAGRRSCSCRARNWSDGLGAAVKRTPVIVGPTAWARRRSRWPSRRTGRSRSISADSRQVYRGLDIGTAKPTRKERAAVPHHGLDLDRAGRALQRGPLCPVGRGVDRRGAVAREAAGGRGRHRPVRARARGGPVRAAGDGCRPAARHRGLGHAASTRSSWCAGPGASTPDSRAADGSAPSVRSRWRC